MDIKKETLAIAKNLMKKDPSLTDWIVSKFPELKESEDEKMRKELIKETKGSEVRLFEIVTNEEFIAWLEKQGEQKSIEWSGKIGVKHAEGKLKEMLDKKENPAWSEEDSAMLDNIVAWIEGKWGTLGGRIGGREKFISFLKSLKDRYTWKPSDEQMEALDDFIYAKYPNIEKHGAEVKSLYQDLKKLRGDSYETNREGCFSSGNR